MSEQNLVALYDTAAHADEAVRDLKAANVPEGAITQHAKSMTSSPTSTEYTQGEHKQGFWASILGGETGHDTAVYDRSVESGSTVVSVRVGEEHVARVSEILEKHGPIDLDERAASYGTAETTTRTTTPAVGARAGTENGTLDLAEESLSVGKRAVAGGTTRIRRFVVETPVEEQVSLHSERVTMDRRPVTDGRTVGNADFTDKSIEMTETNEEAVVGKTARVTEEVSLRKEGADRTETVKDTVRRDEVKVEQVPAGGPGTTQPVPPPAQRRA